MRYPRFPFSPSTRSLVLLLSLALSPWFEGPDCAIAGPNLGGVLIVHDTGLRYSADTFLYPSVAPASIAAVDGELPGGLPAGAEGWIWKVYAAFPEGAEPRLKALAFATDWDIREVKVIDAGLPDPYWDFQIADDGWPLEPGHGVGVSFHEIKTAPVSELYWFAGYAYGTGTWSLRPHARQPAAFVDDATPAHTDPIEGFGVLGLGVAGTTPIPGVVGACCLPQGGCVLSARDACDRMGGTSWGAWIGCEPNPCSLEPGACCLPYAGCVVLDEFACRDQRGVYLGPGVACEGTECPATRGSCCMPNGLCLLEAELSCGTDGGTWGGVGTACLPNPCSAPILGACCLPSGQCVLLTSSQCGEIVGVFSGELSRCLPNPCPQPENPGACCFAAGNCLYRSETDCTAAGGVFSGPGSACRPNPCPQPAGACCASDGTCAFVALAECHDGAGLWLGAETTCDPSPCAGITGSCCLADGSCQVLPQGECNGLFLLGLDCATQTCGGYLGACCFPDGSCMILLENDCSANGGFQWWRATSCAPNPCDATVPVERTTWGRVKSRYAR